MATKKSKHVNNRNNDLSQVSTSTRYLGNIHLIPSIREKNREKSSISRLIALHPPSLQKGDGSTPRVFGHPRTLACHVLLCLVGVLRGPACAHARIPPSLRCPVPLSRPTASAVQCVRNFSGQCAAFSPLVFWRVLCRPRVYMIQGAGGAPCPCDSGLRPEFVTQSDIRRCVSVKGAQGLL